THQHHHNTLETIAKWNHE
ncbi:hypothetical protein D031_3999B, partial [Vibrio parahaemolyticus VP-48]